MADYSSYYNSINQKMNVMEFDSQLHKNPKFKPTYNYNVSSLNQTFNSLAPFTNGSTQGVPAAIQDQVKELENVFKNTVLSIKSEKFKEPNFTSPLEQIQADIKSALEKNKDGSVVGQDNNALTELSSQIKSIQDGGLQKELQHMERNLKVQNDMNLEMTFDNYAMKSGKFKNNADLYYAQGWVNMTENDKYSQEELQGLGDSDFALTNQRDFHNGADGVYAKAESDYKVEKRTDNEGNVSYKATYTNVPMSDLQNTAQGLVEMAVFIVRFYLTIIPVLPILELAINIVNHVATGGKSPSPLGIHSQWYRATHEGGAIFDNREGTPRGEAKAEIDLARNRGRSREIVFGSTTNDPSGNKAMPVKELEKLTVYIDEIKKRSGYENKDGKSPIMKNKEQAMGFRMTQGAESRLRAVLSTQQMTMETEAMVQSFYRNQHDGTLKGYKAKDFKDIIFKEVENMQKAFAPLNPNQKMDKTQSSTITPTANANTSVVTPGGANPTSVISPQQQNPTSSIVPSAPTATSTISAGQTPAVSTLTAVTNWPDNGDPKRIAAAAAITNFATKEELKLESTANLHDTVASAIAQLNGGKEDFIEATLKRNIDLAIAVMPQEEVQALENEGVLTTYRDYVKDTTNDASIAPKVAKVEIKAHEPLAKIEVVPSAPEKEADAPQVTTTARPK